MHRHYTASMAKALVGGVSLALALNDGRLQADDPAWKYIPEWKEDPQKSQITIKQLATHSSGIEDAALSDKEKQQQFARGKDLTSYHMTLLGWKGAFWNKVPDPFTIARDQAPVISKPGAEYHYSNPGMAMLSYAITASYRGTEWPDVRTLLRERIMKPIGLEDAEWSVGYGQTYTVGDLPLVANWGGGDYTPRAVARVGRLMLHKGEWQGQRLIDAAVVEQVLRFAGTPLPPRDPKQHSPASGLGWWPNFDGVWPEVPKDAFMGAGAGNQVLVVIPSLNMIIIRNGEAMYDESQDEGFWYPIEQYVVNPVMRAMIDK